MKPVCRTNRVRVGLLKNSTSFTKGANAAKNRDWERGGFPRACTCFLRSPGFFNSSRVPVHIIVAVFACLIVASAAARAQAAAATATIWATGVEYIEVQAHIVNVAGGAVYVDAGGDNGIVPGMEMTYYETVDITGLDGNRLGQDYAPAGVLRIERVDEAMSVGKVEDSRLEPVRGMIVKYLAPKSSAAPPAAEKTHCPDSMQFVASGTFVYSPGALSRDSFVDAQEFKSETGSFCMDIEPQKGNKSWREARDFCGAQGKRLCGREEMRKACVQNSRRPACPPEQAKAGSCPRGNAVMGFDSALEWCGSWVEDDPATGAPVAKTGSCSCTGMRPACAVCYYPECRGISKKFRCCSNPE